FVVTDSKNQPLEGALVKLESATLNVHQSLTTDSEGKAVFLLLANGNYGVSVSKEGYVSDTNGGITVHNMDGTHIFSLVNTPNHTGGGNNSLEREPIKENPLLNETEAVKNSKVEEVAKIKISQELVKKTGDKVEVDLSKLDLTKELSGIENKEDEKNALNTALKPLVNSESKITLNVPADKNAKELEVTLPKLEKVFEQVDRVSVESDIASFEIKKDTFGELGNDGIKLSATKLDKESLPENLRESIPDGVNEVIDLNAYVKDQKVSNFNAQIEVSMPYTLKNGEDPEKVCVYLLNDNGQIEKVAGAYDVATGKITVKRKHFSKYFIGVSTDTFSDIQNSWAKHPVEVLAGKGIITGKSGGVYDLNDLTTRAEFVSLIARMLSLEPKEDQGIFKDVHTAAWYAESVNAMYQTGIIKGNSDMTFAPEQTITREEVAVILSNTLKYLKMNQTDDISDCQFADKDDVSSWATESVSQVYNMKLMNGYPTGDFKPTSNLNRAEMAQIIYKLFNLYNY
ncbi:MAG: S-layer homology domain-containing protein, partial [Anaerotignum sp.]|nr:S-layer homology domain-containing protein [Anaerotignum sp.]